MTHDPAKPTSLRAFIAVELPPDVKAGLAGPVRELQRDCRAAGLSASWSRPEGWHLTLKFLGAVGPDQLEPITRRLPEAVARHSPFTLRLLGFGAFPSAERARVLWIGIEEDEGKAMLAALARDVEAALAELGWPPEARLFNPHLTLARIKQPRHLPQLVELLERWRAERLATVAVNQVVLMKSQLQPGGSVYTPVALFPLNHHHCQPSAKRL